MGHGENSRSPQTGQTGAGRKEMEEKTRENMITMVTDSGESVDFYVLEETRINARSYLLVYPFIIFFFMRCSRRSQISIRITLVIFKLSCELFKIL